MATSVTVWDSCDITVISMRHVRFDSFLGNVSLTHLFPFCDLHLQCTAQRSVPCPVDEDATETGKTYLIVSVMLWESLKCHCDDTHTECESAGM